MYVVLLVKLRQHTFSNKLMSLKGVPDSAPSAANPACNHICRKLFKLSCIEEIINMVIEPHLKKVARHKNVLYFFYIR